MGIDPESADHLIDARDQQIEGAVERVQKVISVAQDSGASIAPAEHAALVERIQDAADGIDLAGDVETIVGAPREHPEARGTTVELPLATLSAATEQVEGAVERVERVIATTQDSAGPLDVAERSTIVESLDEAARQIEDAVEEVDGMVTAARESTPQAADGSEDTAGT